MRQSEYNANSLLVDTVNNKHNSTRNYSTNSKIALIRQERITKLALLALTVFILFNGYLVVSKLISI